MRYQDLLKASSKLKGELKIVKKYFAWAETKIDSSPIAPP